MKKYKLKSKNKSKNLLITALIVLLIIGVALFAYVRRQNNSTSLTDSTTTPPSDINLSPPTEEEKMAAEQRKDELVQPTPPDNGSQPSGKKQVAVVITQATADSINAYVSGVLEDNGTCTATLTKGGQTITRTSAGFSDVNTTNCTPIKPEFPSSGKWSVTVSYSSSTSEGESKTTVEVP